MDAILDDQLALHSPNVYWRRSDARCRTLTSCKAFCFDRTGGVSSSKRVIESNSKHLHTFRAFYPTGMRPISLFADSSCIRAFPGGIGEFKMGANYAPTILVGKRATELGCQQVLWLYGEDEKLTEVGTMNIFVYWINENGGKKQKSSVFTRIKRSFLSCRRRTRDAAAHRRHYFARRYSRRAAHTLPALGRVQSDRGDIRRWRKFDAQSTRRGFAILRAHFRHMRSHFLNLADEASVWRRHRLRRLASQQHSLS